MAQRLPGGITQRIRNLYETDNYADIVFVVERDGNCQEVLGHKPIFGISSVVFDRIVYGDHRKPVMAPAMVSKKIAIDDVDPEAFKTLKKFIYTEEISFQSVYHARRVYEVAARYEVPPLLEQAKKYLLANVAL